MVEQKKGTKQSTLFGFFSPKKAGKESENAVESEPKSVGSKRPRVSSPGAKAEDAVANSTDKKESEGENKAGIAKSKAKAKPNARVKTKGTTKASPKAKTKYRKKRQPPVRFISPHAAVDSEDDDDLDEEEDVFSTPEAKRARAELETGGELVPAGSPISDDAIVMETDIVDVSGEDKIGVDEAVSKDDRDGVVDLSAASAPYSANDEVAKPTEDTESAKKSKGKAAKLPATSNNKPTAKTPTKTPSKRQQKMKEKAVAEATSEPVKPLDPAIQARVDAYKLKTEELTRQYTELLHSKLESDMTMQDIYGAGLDRDMDVIVDHRSAQQALVEVWLKLRDHAYSASSAADTSALPSTVEFPHEVKCLIVKGIQGRTTSLSVVTSELLSAFKKALEVDDVDMKATEKTSALSTENVDSTASLALEMEIKMLAQRIAHGVRPAKANLFEDTTSDALWVWEVGSLEKYFSDEAQKTIKRMRKHRKRLGMQLKTLTRVSQLLHQKPVDETKVSAEEAKVAKFGFAVDAELQKAKEREAKEQEKRNAAEEKKRHELERQHAKEVKDEEKQKRKREEEEKKKGASPKRQKMFKSFFATAPAASSAVTSEAIDVTGDQDMEKTSEEGESRKAKIMRMDATISFLGSTGDESLSSLDSADNSQQSILSSLKGKRETTKKQLNAFSPDGWSGRRHRDPKLGVMKLLQFYENNRPAYYGTLSQNTLLFRGGRRPLAQYAKLDYSVDSDDEWEEEEPGESLSDDDNDGEESDEDNLDYGDQWLAYEDEVDYMDDVEAEDDSMEREEGSSSPTKHKLPSQLQKKRVKAKTIKPAKLEPQIIGPFWCCDSQDKDCEGHFPGLAGELLCEPVFESTLMRKAREYEEEQKHLEDVRPEQQRKKEQQQEQEKLKTQEKKSEEAKLKKDFATAKFVSTKQAGKIMSAKAVTQKTSPVKASLQKTTPPKPKTQKASAEHPAASPIPAKLTSVAASASKSPAKSSAPQIDSYFEKVAGPVSALSNPTQPTDEQEKAKDSSVEVISVDEF